MAIRIILSLIVSYLLGSIPTAYIFGRVFKGIDIRKTGSGNVGATNALRVLGPLPAVAILIIDILKGAVCPWLIADFFLGEGDLLLFRILLGVVAIAGHNWTIFLNFRGGKGVATTLGMFLGLALKVNDLGIILILSLGVWLSVFILSRIVSLASIVTATLLPFFMLLFRQRLCLIVVSLTCAVLIIYRHKSNIIRMLRKEEPPLNLS